jgi:hypothetical protein
VGKYGTNLEGFGAFEGGVNADKGAPLVSTSSDGETALLFGPAALREIQAGVANGDFAIPPDAAGDTITAENPLPYWTFTDDDSAGAITCAIVADSGSGSGNLLRWTVAAGTTTGKTATLSRYVAVPATRDKAYAFYPEFTMGAATNAASRQIVLTLQFYTANQTTTGTAITHTYSFSDFNSTRTAVMLYGDTASRLQAPADAAFAKISMAIDTTGTNASQSTLDVYEIRLLAAPPMILLASRVATAGPAAIWKSGAEEISIAPNIPTSWSSGSLGTDRLLMQMVDGADPEIRYVSTLGEVAHLVTGYYYVNPALATSTAFGANTVSGEATSRFQILANGKLEIGDGTNAYDTNLYRSAANTLKTDDSFVIGGANSNLLARIINTAGQSLTNNTDTKLIFNTASSTPASESYDPQGWFNNANDSIDIGQDGFYCITANVSFATNATGRRAVTLVLNGTGISSVVLSASSSSATNLVSTTNMYLFSGDQVTVNGFQNSGGALNTLVQASGAFTALSVGRIGA